VRGIGGRVGRVGRVGRGAPRRSGRGAGTAAANGKAREGGLARGRAAGAAVEVRMARDDPRGDGVERERQPDGVLVVELEELCAPAASAR